MPLSPLDIESRSFKKKLYGYDASEVDAFLALVADALQQVILQRDEQARRAEELTAQLESFRKREAELIEGLSESKRIGEERRAIAQQEAEAIVASARSHAESIIARTRKDLGDVEQQIARAQYERERFENSLSSLLDYHRRLLELRRDQQQAGGTSEKPPSRSTMPPPHRPSGD
jgi:cell division initiation protein